MQYRLKCYASRRQSYNQFPPKPPNLGKGLIYLQTTMMTVTVKTVTENLATHSEQNLGTPSIRLANSNTISQ